MYDINFLTDDYLRRLKRNQNIRRYSLMIGSVTLLELFIFIFLFTWNNSIESDLGKEQKSVISKEKNIAKIKVEMEAIPDLTDKIDVLNDIFTNKKFRISEVIKDLDENTPDNIWFNSITYEDGVISLDGGSYRNIRLGLSSEENLYLFEKKLIESGAYKSIIHDMTRVEGIAGDKIVYFRFQLELE